MSDQRLVGWGTPGGVVAAPPKPLDPNALG